MDYDGEIIIGTDVDSKNVDKEIAKLQKKLEKFSKEEEQLLSKKAKLEIDISKAERDMDNFDAKAQNTYNKLQEEKLKLANIPTWKQESDGYSKQVDKVNQLEIKYNDLVAKNDTLNDKYQNQVQSLSQINTKLKENATNQEIFNNKLEEAKAHQLGVNLDFDKMGNKIEKTIKKVSKLVLSVFSIRTAYSAVSSAMSTLTQYNDDMNNKIQTIKLVLAEAIEPIVTKLINFVYKLVTYMNYIYKAWFGVDLFAKATSDNVNKANKSAKELKKTLTGFDEATVLNENGTTSSLGTSSDFQIVTPEDVEIPSWIKWIAEHGEEVATILGTIAGAIAAFKFVSFITGLSKASGALGNFGKTLSTGLILTGLLMIAGAVIDLIKNWDELTPAQKRADTALILLGASFTTLGVTIMAAINTATFGLGGIIGIIATLVTGIAGLVLAFGDQEKSIKSVEQAEMDLKTAIEETRKATEDYANALDSYDNALATAEEATRKLEEAEKKNNMSGADLQKQVEAGTLTYQNMTDAQKEVYKAYWDNINAQENLKKVDEELQTATENLTTAKKNEKIESWEDKLAIAAEKGAYDEYKKAVVDAYEKGELSADEARDLIGKSMSEMSRDTQKAFMEDLPDAVKDGLDPKKYETAGQKFKKFFDGLCSNIKSGVSSAWDWVTSKFGWDSSSSSSSSSKSSKTKGYAKGGIVYPKLEYLASGGIISLPGRGVPLTQAIGGERGREGILPLDDSQQMELLGETIGKYININLTNVTNMNGRTINRELKKIGNNSDFAMNR